MHAALGEAREAGERERVPDARVARSCPHPVRHVLAHVHVRKEGVVLEDQADTAPFGRHVYAGRRDDVVEEREATGVRSLESGDQSQRGRLAAPGGPENREQLAAHDLQREVDDGGHGVVRARETLSADRQIVVWHGHRLAAGWSSTTASPETAISITAGTAASA